ncbi:MAG TPA: hypothetical protein VIX17_26430 [Pyrinomonadaceae bacterium]
MRKSLFVLLLIMSVCGLCSAQQSSPANWTKLQFLVGTFNAAGSGSPGEGAGAFSFSFDLQNRVLVRHSHTDYPAASNRPAFAHDDLMIIYADEQQLFHADYYDNEGHVIRYTIESSADGNTWTFISDTLASRPRFRLTYSKASEAELKIKFEIAPPDQPNDFKKYVEGTARRK